MRRPFIRLLLAALLIALPLTVPAAQAQDRVTAEELTELRQSLAQARLELRQTRAELDRIRGFLAEQNLDEKLAAWEQQREELAAERRRLMMEKRELETLRKQLHQTTSRSAKQRAETEAEAREAAAEAAKPKWSAQYRLSFIHLPASEIDVRVDGRHATVDRDAQIDPRNVRVRGNFMNHSPEDWRFTFTIAVATDDAVVARWRYQTPLLTPGELHQFDLVVPVEEVIGAERLQIGNVVADRIDAAPRETVEQDRARP